MRGQQRGLQAGAERASAPLLTRAPSLRAPHPPQHPVESTLYLSYALFPALFGAHPIACIYIELNLIAAAMIGHSGFEAPASGSFPHFLHHVRRGAGAHPTNGFTSACTRLDGLCVSPCLLSSPTPPRLDFSPPQSLTQVNFAENHLPLDLLFGTWAGDETEARASMRARGFAPGIWKDAALEAAGGAEGEPMKKPLHAKKAA